MNPADYLSSMEPHTKDDQTISWEEQVQLEKCLSGHSIQFGRILKMGEKWNDKDKHWPRVK